MSIPEEPIERARNAVRDEYGSVLCAWIDMDTKRCCAINVPPHKCRCDAIARAALEASGLFAAGQLAGLREAFELCDQHYVSYEMVYALNARIAELQREGGG